MPKSEIPQPTSCGPIEAGCRNGLFDEDRESRSQQAAAPLKPALSKSGAAEISQSRSQQAAAPLKRSYAPGDRGGDGTIPQPTSCGPIEALLFVVVRFIQPGIPQPTSCGPIEAPWIVVRSACSVKLPSDSIFCENPGRVTRPMRVTLSAGDNDVLGTKAHVCARQQPQRRRTEDTGRNRQDRCGRKIQKLQNDANPKNGHFPEPHGPPSETPSSRPRACACDLPRAVGFRRSYLRK